MSHYADLYFKIQVWGMYFGLGIFALMIIGFVAVCVINYWPEKKGNRK